MDEKDSKLAVVCVTSGLLQAEIIKGRLESAGFPVLLQYESAGLVIGLTIDGLGEVKVMVPGHLEAQAKAVLESQPDLSGEDDESARS